ncbi:hypothetical protein C8Q74DRAFT_1373105 [Fomes fomentarius]|nr:hypothetical protein C8Q74DRAFT_1373105 [Fomes fomentarius]
MDPLHPTRPPLAPSKSRAVSSSTGAAVDPSTEWPKDSGASAAPWLIFPPFPDPPPGVEIIPFVDFKPLGIIISEVPENANGGSDAEEQVEVDGLGIPTVPLRVHHELTAMERDRKGKRKPKKGGNNRRVIWYEDWAQTESSRRLSVPLDQSLSRVDRLHQAAADFRNGRPLKQNQELSTIWDRFRLFVGLISSMDTPIARKFKAHARKEQEEALQDEREDGELDELPNVPQPSQQQRAVTVVDDPMPPQMTSFPPSPLTDEQKQQRREYFRELRDTRMDWFLNAPEPDVKIFFSGYYREIGMIYSQKFCADGPILIRFFLNFLLRNRVLPEYEKMLKKAVAVTDAAAMELPHTFVISKAAPDDKFSKGCELLFGSMTDSTWWVHEPKPQPESETAEEGDSEREAKRQKLDNVNTEASILQEVAGSEDIQVVTPDAVAMMEQEIKEHVSSANINGREDAPISVPAIDSEQNADWGNGADAPAGNDNDAASWGDPGRGDPPSADKWGGPTESPFVQYLGPTTLPLTHTTGIVERSTRRIKSINIPIPPEPSSPKQNRSQHPPSLIPAPLADPEGVEHELEAAFAKMTMVPWHEWDVHEHADVQKPRLLRNSRGTAVSDDTADAPVVLGREGYSTSAAPHNPFKDAITVYLEPSTAELMRVGMGIGATWVQLARVDPGVPVEADAETFDNMYAQRKKGLVGGPGTPVAPTDVWYMEQVMAVYPSFHTEMVPLPTRKDVFGEEAL